MNTEKKTMRDVFIERIYTRMLDDDTIFFLSADFGSPKLDRLRKDYSDRFINVGIAEQNLINVATGLALEGFTVYAYAIAPFLTMRAYEQIRNNLSLLSRTHDINVNLIGVGAGLSYDVSGPTHHCIEDISIIRTLPNITIFSPSDWVLAEKFVDYSIENKRPKYLRFDSKPLPDIYGDKKTINLEKGFFELAEGNEICLVTTGYMVHTALSAVNTLAEDGVNIGLIDMFLLKPFNSDHLFEKLSKYKYIIAIEEAFIGKGGLDSIISDILSNKESNIKLKKMGFSDNYVFDIGSREHLHKLNNMDKEGIIKNIKDTLKKY